MSRSHSHKERSSGTFTFDEKDPFGRRDGLQVPLVPRRTSTVEHGPYAGDVSRERKPERRRQTRGLALGLAGMLALGWFGGRHVLPAGWNGDAKLLDGLSSEIQLDPAVDVIDARETLVIPDDPTHILVPQKLNPAKPLLRPLYDRLDASVLSSFFVDGVLPDYSPRAEVPPIDIVYLWVNSSGPVFNEAMVARAETEEIEVDTGDGKRYRDNGELRGAMRSAKSALHGLGTMHVLSGDYPVPGDFVSTEIPEHGEWKLGQIPEWLDWASVQDGSAGLRWHFHSDVFRIPVDDYDSPEDKALDREYEVEWRDLSVPSFNSFAIESRVGWVDGLAENFILANDDMFMMRDLSRSDFSHPLLGDIIRADNGLLVEPEIGDDLLSTGGEWGGLQHASQMISRRFPSLARGYMYHVPKALSVSLMHEASVMWEDELTEAATRGFRRSVRGMGDVEISWLVGFLRVERWREALLWSWAVARMGGESGVWGSEAREEVKRVLHVTATHVDAAMVIRGERSTLADIQAINQQMGWEGARQTEYVFSSMDGVMHQRNGDDSMCLFDFATCLPPNFFSDPHRPIDADEMFRHLAFEEPTCGDCMIKALVAASGPRGLSAVLPLWHQTLKPEIRPHRRWERSEPILPLTDTWQLTNFSAHAIVRPNQDQWRGSHQEPDGRVNLRQWCIKLLSRYAYTVGSTSWQFDLIQNIDDLETALGSLDDPNGERAALACLNDDQPDDADDAVRERFGEWMEEKWMDVDARWERDGASWV